MSRARKGTRKKTRNTFPKKTIEQVIPIINEALHDDICPVLHCVSCIPLRLSKESDRESLGKHSIDASVLYEWVVANKHEVSPISGEPLTAANQFELDVALTEKVDKILTRYGYSRDELLIYLGIDPLLYRFFQENPVHLVSPKRIPSPPIKYLNIEAWPSRYILGFILLHLHVCQVFLMYRSDIFVQIKLMIRDAIAASVDVRKLGEMIEWNGFQYWRESAFPLVCDFNNLTAINQLPEKLQAYFHLAEEKLSRSDGPFPQVAGRFSFFSLQTSLLQEVSGLSTIVTVVAEGLYYIILIIFVDITALCFVENAKYPQQQPLLIKALCYFYALYITLVDFWVIEAIVNGSLSSNFIQTIISTLPWDYYTADILAMIAFSCNRLTTLVGTNMVYHDHILQDITIWSASPSPSRTLWSCVHEEKEEQSFFKIFETTAAKCLLIIILLAFALPTTSMLLEIPISAMNKLLEGLISTIKKGMQHCGFSKSKNAPEKAFAHFTEQGYPSTAIPQLSL